MKTKLKALWPIILMSLVPTFLIWLPFFLRLESFWTIPLPQNGMATIVANYDGPLYIVIAKTLYNKALITTNYAFSLPAEYYAAHLPLFPWLIRAFSSILGYPYAMLGITLTSSVLALYFFNKLALQFVKEKNDALWLTFVFSILPARWLIVRSVGSAEPLFVAAIIASIYYFRNKKYWYAGIWGVVAQLIKSPGILLFIAYAFAIIAPHINKLATTSINKWAKILSLKKVYPLILIPISLLGVFVYYQFVFNDFWAYFNSGDNIHLFFPPFQIFNYSAPWVGTFWLEEIIFVYLIGLMGLIKLFKQKAGAIAWFVGIFFTSILFVSHRDIIRYSLPIIPFLILAFSKTIIKKDFKIVMCVLAVPIYLFSLAYISQNVMQISDWAPFL
jgi:Gpi18-like mannosyltransferase